MNMIITNEARDELKKMFEEENAKNIRIFANGFGWGQPRFGLTLDEPEANDRIFTINDIKVAIDPFIQPDTEYLILDRSGNGKGISIVDNTGACC